MRRDSDLSDLRWHFLDPKATRTLAIEPKISGLDGSEPRAQPRASSTGACARMTRLAGTLHEVYAELCRVHTGSVVAFGTLASDRECLTSALTEARHRHEVLYLVRRAAEALDGAVRRIEG